MQRIELRRHQWMFDPAQALGPAGGFGAVFAGRRADDGTSVAIKRIHVVAGDRAARELELADYLTGHEFAHVIPVLDAGFDAAAARHFIVMARADTSLQDTIERGAPLPEGDAIEIADAIAAGLAEIGDIVHRDLKPGNVLLHNGVWKLADLGLARFVEEATSLQTMKDCLSPPYASPEQWRGERATKKSDIYALGCILHALLTGNTPFSGPTHADYQDQHLNQIPPDLPASPALRRLVTACLSKSPLARPTVDSFRAQLQATRVDHLKNPNFARLAKVVANLERKRLSEEAARQQRDAKIAERRDAAKAGLEMLAPIIETLADFITSIAPAAKIERSNDALTVELEGCYLEYSVELPVVEERNRWLGDWDVLAGAFIGVRWGGITSQGNATRSANLWFADIEGDGSCRWWETAFHETAAAPSAERRQRQPFGLGRDAKYDYGNHRIEYLGHGWYRLAYNPRPADGEAAADFCERWAGLFATVLEQGSDFAVIIPPEEPLEERFGRPW